MCTQRTHLIYLHHHHCDEDGGCDCVDEDDEDYDDDDDDDDDDDGRRDCDCDCDDNDEVDCDFDQLPMFCEDSHESMSNLMNCHLINHLLGQLILDRLEADKDSIRNQIQVILRNLFSILPKNIESRFIQEVFDLRSRKPVCQFGQIVHRDRRIQRFIVTMDLKDLLSCLLIRGSDVNLFIDASRT